MAVFLMMNSVACGKKGPLFLPKEKTEAVKSKVPEKLPEKTQDKSQSKNEKNSQEVTKKPPVKAP